MLRFQLWFPFTAKAAGIPEAELPATHNRPLGAVMRKISAQGRWTCEQAYITEQTRPFTLPGQVPSHFFPLSFRQHPSSQRGGQQWSLSALWQMLVRPPAMLGVFFAYGLFPKALAWVARLRRVPYFIIVAGWYNRISRSQRTYFDNAFRVLVHTEMQKQALVQVGYRPDNIVIFPLGVDLMMFTPKPATAYAPRPDWPRLLYVGRLQASKGPLEALQTFAAVKRHHPAATLTLAGPCRDAGFQQQMHAYIRAQGLQAAVQFAGPVAHDQLPPYYQAADLFLFPSPYEGLPQVVLESMACGTPPVVLRGSGGTEEAVVHGEVGWVVDPPRLAYDVVQILENPAQLQACGEKAAQRIAAHYGEPRTLAVLAEILAAVYAVRNG